MTVDLLNTLAFTYVFVTIVVAMLLYEKYKPPALAIIWPLMFLKHFIEETFKYFSHWNFK